MATHLPSHHHPHHPIRLFTIEHPNAPDWALVITGTLIGLLLWHWTS